MFEVAPKMVCARPLKVGYEPNERRPLTRQFDMTTREYKSLGAASTRSTEIELIDRALSSHSLRFE